MKVKGIAMKVKGIAMKVKGIAMKVKGIAMKVKGIAMKVLIETVMPGSIVRLGNGRLAQVENKRHVLFLDGSIGRMPRGAEVEIVHSSRVLGRAMLKAHAEREGDGGC